ncbi:MAG: stress response protein [Actinomycetota bacterium]|nr:stress response protein [Actinomycetota bacterium]
MGVVIQDDQWPVARLIPISSASGIEAQERRAASALLAVMSAVNEFGRALVKPLGAPAGKIETFIEIPFKLSDGRSIRPDGIITVSRGSKSWGAIVETKVAAASLEREQIDAYLDLARELGFEAVLSISNHYVTSSMAYPIEVDKRKKRRVALHHWSWIDVLTEAVLQRRHRGVSDPDQAYILNELIRYLKDERSGAVSLGSMGPSWTAVKDGAREQTLRRNDDHVAAVTARWDDLIRYLGLELTMELGRDVRQVVSREEREPDARQQALRESLASTGRLYAQLQVPNVAGILEITADLRSRQITVGTTLPAPQEGRTKGRVSWLLRQLQNAPDTLKITTKAARSSATYAASLSAARENAEVLYPEANREIKGFGLSLTRNMGLKRDAGKGSFIESVISTTEDFYQQVLQNLRPWKASPPKLPRKDEAADEVPAEVPPELVPPVEAARAEGDVAATQRQVSI